MANLATNHCLDRGEQGIANELEAFSNTNIVTDGVYTSQEAFNTIPTFKKKGITFSFLAYTYGTNGIAPDYDYNVSYLDDDQIKSDVQKAKEISDVVIVSGVMKIHLNQMIYKNTMPNYLRTAVWMSLLEPILIQFNQ